MTSPHKAASSLGGEQQQRLDAIVAELEPAVEAGTFWRAFEALDAHIEALDKAASNNALRAALLTLRAELRVDADENAAAASDAREAIGLGWNNAQVHGVAGWAYFNLENYEQARQHFAQALKYDPDEVALLRGHALALLELEEFEHARADLTHAIHVDKADPELYAMRSEICLRMGELESAERDIRYARELDAEDPDFALALSRLLLVSGRVDEALSVVDDAIGSGNELSLEALLLRSHLRLLAGQSKEARDDAMRASNQFPDEAFAFVQLAHVQLAEGNVSLSNKAAERAVKLDPSLPDAYLVRGTALHMSGKSELAKEDLERASRAPAELPMFLLGPAFGVLESTGFNSSLLDMINEQSQGGPASLEDAFASLSGMAGMGGSMGDINPMNMLGQLFDDSGNIRGPLKPFFEMAFKNAPKIMQNMPPGLLSNLGGFDPAQLEDLDLSNLSSEQIEEQMREFYRRMKSGENPGPSDDDED
ncbi:MAG: tetratricopeptide repeat protein [Bradymonadaceae bacterium]|nr:tetratricopeptide repeat protein [Lujinxingiaceae bacterium]